MAQVRQVVLSNSSTGSTEWAGGLGALSAVATSWGVGSSLKLQYLAMDGETWIDVGMTPLEADGLQAVTIPMGRIRAVVTAATTGLEAWIHTV